MYVYHIQVMSKMPHLKNKRTRQTKKVFLTNMTKGLIFL